MLQRRRLGPPRFQRYRDLTGFDFATSDINEALTRNGSTARPTPRLRAPIRRRMGVRAGGKPQLQRRAGIVNMHRYARLMGDIGQLGGAPVGVPCQAPRRRFETAQHRGADPWRAIPPDGGDGRRPEGRAPVRDATRQEPESLGEHFREVIRMRWKDVNRGAPHPRHRHSFRARRNRR